MNRLLALAALAGLAGCVVGPAYKRPDLQLPETHRFGEQSQQAPEASLADLKWWEIVRDPVLQQLIREALAGNPDLKVASTRVVQSAALARAAGAELWPRLDAFGNVSYGRESLQVNPLAETGDRYGLGVGLSWELDLWGKVRSAREASLADLRASEGFRDAARASLVAAVAQAYIELRALDLQLDITRAAAEARRGSLELVENRARGGVGNDLEMNQARADWANAEAAIPATERAIALQEHRLCILLGRTPGPSSAARPCWARPSRRRCRAACPPRCCGAGPTWPPPRRRWWPPPPAPGWRAPTGCPRSP
ncbi:MAG: TolC family protein [Anaeromyxobacter sp.]